MQVAFSLSAVGLAVACAGAETPVEHPDAVTADPDHYSVEFENDAVRLLRIEYGPGETSVMHRHPANCAIFLHDQPVRFEDAAGEVTEPPANEMGTVMCGDEDVHLPTNMGDESLELVLVEFKEGATPGTASASEYPDAVTADPEHYSVEFENDVARIVRVNYAAGEGSVMHHHPANCAIFVHDQPITFEQPDGEVIEAPASETGALICGDEEVHLPTNAGEGPAEVILIEFKGRDTFTG